MSKRSGLLFLTRLRQENQGGFILKYPLRERTPKEVRSFVCR